MSLDVIPSRADWPMVVKVYSHFPTLRGSQFPYAIGSATLIDQKGLLTAAHVVYDPDRGGTADFFEISFGDGSSATVSGSNGRIRREWINGGANDALSMFDFGVIKLDAAAAPRPANISPTQLMDLSGVPLNVLGFNADQLFPTLDEFLLGARTTAIDLGQPLNGFRVGYPEFTHDGMSGGPILRVDEIGSGTFILRGIHTTLLDSQGNGLMLYSSLFQQVRSWL
jgi:hypothetical protein